MSIANIVVGQDKALIGFDTKTAFMNAPAPNVEAAFKMANGEAHTSKAFFLPHANVAIPTLGDNLLALLVFQQLQLRPDLTDLDGMIEAMPEILATAYNQSMAIRKQQWGIDAFHGSAIFLVGWSKALNRMEGVRWTRWATDRAFTASQARVSLNPETETEHATPYSDAEMEAVAREQVAHTRKTYPNGEYDCGGRLLVAELTRDTLSVRTIANLEE